MVKLSAPPARKNRECLYARANEVMPTSRRAFTCPSTKLLRAGGKAATANTIIRRWVKRGERRRELSLQQHHAISEEDTIVQRPNAVLNGSAAKAQ
jgi:hypothetical protein